ncbi:uncharacterized protein M421DRAFT_422987 [Didymella exigua CBS 183.55]|uniref:Uncharacterized protein n=1 Tax=Didymella exigua CBS 183.55 TaxID=1150837 RepID=A0A6A5RL82_9PLEO|nr:uncharacterized protein M421DRAFT_422987 [Didymella exigua CBS 183.55]KAF1926297.1 hypothetical protein M421DRAFT_422987 [Didymella exigua CBS 183.55]
MVSSRAAHLGHARLHKRGHSASSSLASPLSPLGPLSPVVDGGAFTFSRSETPKTTIEEWTELPRQTPANTSSHPLNIKPYVRKLSSKNANSLDLSRPAAENESLASLGIAAEYSGPYSRSISDVPFSPVSGRHRHTRSTSNNSQFSTSSAGLTRPTPMPAMRPTPQPTAYLPPASRSSPSSELGAEHAGDDIMSDEEFRVRQNAYEPGRRSGSMSSVPGASLRIHTNNSSTRLANNYSQSTISLTSPVAQARSRGDTLKSIDTTTSPSSRTSFDQGLRFIRGGRDSPIDAASRAASIRAARAKFDEEQLAKERRYEKELSKQAERDSRRQAKRQEHQRRKSEATDRADYKRSRSVSDSATNEKQPRPSVGGRQYSDHREAHVNSLPKHVSTVDLEKVGVTPEVTTKRAAKGRWLSFVTWFKTRLLRMSRKVST